MGIDFQFHRHFKLEGLACSICSKMRNKRPELSLHSFIDCCFQAHEEVGLPVRHGALAQEPGGHDQVRKGKGQRELKSTNEIWHHWFQIVDTFNSALSETFQHRNPDKFHELCIAEIGA